MNVLGDIISYLRRIVKTPSNASLSDNLIIDYINRFWLMDVDARMQLFDLKTNYVFQTIPGIASYNMPLYDAQVQPGDQVIASFPVYQGFMAPAYINGLPVSFSTEQDTWWNFLPSNSQFLTTVGVGDGSNGPYTIQLGTGPLVPGHLDMTGIIANINLGGGNQDPIFTTQFPLDSSNTFIQLPTTSFFPTVYFTATAANGQLIQVSDSGVFLSNATDGDLHGLLMAPGNAPLGNRVLSGNYTDINNTINYNTGQAIVTFPAPIPVGTNINAQTLFVQPGIPLSISYYNNTIKLRTVPNASYNVQLTAYLTPAAFLRSGNAIPFGYMAEYIARGAARKILADTGDIEQFQFYEPLFKEQELLVWKRSQRQFTATRTNTIYSQSGGLGNSNQFSGGWL